MAWWVFLSSFSVLTCIEENDLELEVSEPVNKKSKTIARYSYTCLQCDKNTKLHFLWVNVMQNYQISLQNSSRAHRSRRRKIRSGICTSRSFAARTRRVGVRCRSSEFVMCPSPSSTRRDVAAVRTDREIRIISGYVSVSPVGRSVRSIRAVLNDIGCLYVSSIPLRWKSPTVCTVWVKKNPP